LADPTGSVLYEYVKTGQLVESGSWAVEGIGEDFVPEIADMSLVTDAFEIDDEESFSTARELLKREGIFGGSSTGTLVAGALRYCRQQKQPKRVVSLVPDTGNKYLSKMYNDYWLRDQGLIDRPSRGDLTDLISRPHAEGAVVTLSPSDTLATAHRRMRLYDVSQLPVLEDEKLVGIIDESDLLMAVHDDPVHFNAQVCAAMVTRLETVAPSGSLADLMAIFAKDRVAVVEENGKFLGLITRIDLINHLRRRVR
jgi:cystathionine beta-synthase